MSYPSTRKVMASASSECRSASMSPHMPLAAPCAMRPSRLDGKVGPPTSPTPSTARTARRGAAADATRKDSYTAPAMPSCATRTGLVPTPRAPNTRPLIARCVSRTRPGAAASMSPTNAPAARVRAASTAGTGARDVATAVAAWPMSRNDARDRRYRQRAARRYSATSDPVGSDSSATTSVVATVAGFRGNASAAMMHPTARIAPPRNARS